MMVTMPSPSTLACLLILSAAAACSQPKNANYDEAKVPAYTLPDPLKMADGKPVTDRSTWTAKRRPELIHLFEENIYGISPARPKRVVSEVLETSTTALGGKAIRKQVRVHFLANDGPGMDVLMYLPASKQGRVPVFLSLNFGGNQTVSNDPAIILTKSWVAKSANAPDNQATEKSRGSAISRWPIEHILERGYGVVTAYYGDIEPDYNGGINNSVRKLFLTPGHTAPAVNEWGAVAAWAWGLSRIMDYLETDPDVNPQRVAVLGHSRLGKAALWAGARDPRFAVVISNDSGEGGAALSRRKFGEQVKNLNTSFPHWFAPNYTKFNDREEYLPVDMHELIALVAPRPVYVASAEEDRWSDPHGEFLSAKAASPVYKLFGESGLDGVEMPPVHQPVMNRIGYHIRTGKHDITLYDWDRFIDFTDKWMK